MKIDDILMSYTKTMISNLERLTIGRAGMPLACTRVHGAEILSNVELLRSLDPLCSAHPCKSLESVSYECIKGLYCLPLLACFSGFLDKIMSNLNDKYGKAGCLRGSDVVSCYLEFLSCERLDDVLWYEKFFALVVLMGGCVMFCEVVGVVEFA